MDCDTLIESVRYRCTQRGETLEAFIKSYCTDDDLVTGMLGQGDERLLASALVELKGAFYKVHLVIERSALRYLSPTLRAEKGMPGVGVAIWRWEQTPTYHQGTVGEFLMLEAHQSSEWFIDGGWGGPPGPIRVRWSDADGAWKNLGFPPWDNRP